MALILVVDDDEDIRDMLQRVLENAGYEVVTTDDTGAIPVAQTSQPAAILLDLLMPLLTGEEICRRLRADPATAAIPVVAMSASRNIAALADQTIFTDRLVKPFRLPTLADTLARCGPYPAPPTPPIGRLGAALDRFQAEHGWSDAALAAALHTSERALPALRWCALPTSDLQITRITNAFGLNRLVLTQIVEGGPAPSP